ncbi:MAG TPA: hypothetical protein VGN07_03515 [Steroidobacteraceae bacterium]|jgi:hypothetical protein
MAIRPNQPQTIGGVLDISFQLYKAAIGSVWPLSLLMILASSPQSIYALVHGGFTVNPSDPTAALAMYRLPGYWLTTLLGLALTLWVGGALVKKTNAIGADEELGVGAALQATLGNLGSLVAMTILFMLAVGIGLVLLAVPGLILMVSLILGTILIVVEGRGPIAALGGSHRLVWGDWWRTSAVLTVGFLIVLVAYVAVGLVAGVVVAVVGLGSDPIMSAMVSVLIVSAVMNLFLTPYYVSLLLSIYWDLKLRKEGGDLAARVGALGTA